MSIQSLVVVSVEGSFLTSYVKQLHRIKKKYIRVAIQFLLTVALKSLVEEYFSLFSSPIYCFFFVFHCHGSASSNGNQSNIAKHHSGGVQCVESQGSPTQMPFALSAPPSSHTHIVSLTLLLINSLACQSFSFLFFAVNAEFWVDYCPFWLLGQNQEHLNKKIRKMRRKEAHLISSSRLDCSVSRRIPSSCNLIPICHLALKSNCLRFSFETT